MTGPQKPQAGPSRYRLHEADAARFYPASRTAANVRDRAAESFNKMYGIVHPREQYESTRPMRVSAVHERTLLGRQARDRRASRVKTTG